MKKILFLIISCCFLLQMSYAYESNDNYTDLYLDRDGWCINSEIPFKLYNDTDWQNREEIEDNLCEGNETPEDDGCQEFNEFDDVVIIIHDGPLEQLPIIYNKTLSENIEFSHVFDKENGYLVEIYPEGEYNDYHEVMEVIECQFSSPVLINDDDNETSETTEPEKIIPKLTNQTFEYLNSEFILNLKDTSIALENEITVKKDIPIENKLENTLKIVEITSKNNEFSSMSLQTSINKQNNTILKTFIYNDDSQDWEETSFTEDEENIIIEIPKYGIYAIVEEANIVESDIVTTDDEETSDNENSDNIANNETNTTGNDSNMMLYLIVGFVIIGGGIGAYIFLGHKTKLTAEPHKEILSSYDEVYKKTQLYVKEHKKNFLKDQIYRGLKQANVPKDIIDKVFDEEYE